MMLRRRGGPGVLGTMARTAVIAGTATAVSNKVHQAGAARAAQQQQLAQPAAPEVPESAAPPAEVSGAADLIAKLKHLAQLRTMDVLSDEEFSRAAVKLLTD